MMGQQRGRILLIDDEPLVRKFISRCLVAAGYVVQVAVDGLGAIGKLLAGPMDLIISDLKMPRMSGAEAREDPALAIPNLHFDPVGLPLSLFHLTNGRELSVQLFSGLKLLRATLGVKLNELRKVKTVSYNA
jgi:hypothetical protein